MQKDYDFAGFVTKNDIRCSDGVIIKHDAFSQQDGSQVPLVWQHNHDSASNVLGSVRLCNVPNGVYGYGSFNDSDEAVNAREAVKHGDINAMSIFANRIKRQGNDVVHGNILEVSLVMSGANPGAMIDEVVAHSESSDEQAIIYPDLLMHSSEEELDDTIEYEDGGSNVKTEPETKPKEDDDEATSEGKTIGEVFDTLNDEQRSAVEAMIGAAIAHADSEDVKDSKEGTDKSEDDDHKDNPEDTKDKKNPQTVEHQEKGGKIMKHNVFAKTTDDQEGVLSQGELGEILGDAKELGTLKDSYVKHSITNIETLFPEAKQLNPTPVIYKDRNTAAETILNAITKSPFSRIKTRYADFTEDEARARGYIKGKEKKEQIFSVLGRETTPQTIYKKQKLDRDDIIDITDFDVVSFVGSEMRMMLNEEIARAVMVGDGRSASSDDKIKEDHIRPIIKDDDLYTIKAPEAANVRSVIAIIIKAMADYQGSGAPILYLHPALLAEMRLITAADGRFLFGDIPSKEAIAARLGVSGIQESTFFPKNGYLIVNLHDYQLGATKGGQVTNFDDFDIDFNQYKYLIETRLSGALTTLKSAIYGTVKADVDGSPLTDNPSIDVTGKVTTNPVTAG